MLHLHNMMICSYCTTYNIKTYVNIVISRSEVDAERDISSLGVGTGGWVEVDVSVAAAAVAAVALGLGILRNTQGRDP